MHAIRKQTHVEMQGMYLTVNFVANEILVKCNISQLLLVFP